MQVNKALQTCTSWYAHAAMFGSSTHESNYCQNPVYAQPSTSVRLFNLLGPLLCRPKPLALMQLYSGLEGHLDSRQACDMLALIWRTHL